jgi:hypothetical protein
MGRHTTYKPEYAQQARYACENYGLTDQGLADVFDVEPSTLAKWKKDVPDFSEAVRAGKAIFDNAVVVQAAMKLITGFEYQEQVLGPGGVAVTLKKFCHPNTRVFELWMRNRQGWRINDLATTIKVTEPEESPTGVSGYQDLAKRLMEDRYGTRILDGQS